MSHYFVAKLPLNAGLFANMDCHNCLAEACLALKQVVYCMKSVGTLFFDLRGPPGHFSNTTPSDNNHSK